jgi:sulfate adenylyltransferase large subunit
MTARPDPTAFALETFLHQQERKSLLRFVVCGSVDHGKSTLIGRLLYEAKLLFEDQVEALTASARRAGPQQEIDFSLLLDGLAAEREQKITIDVAYRFFTTDKRKFIVADAPGHEEYTRNMATGASTADAAVILVNAAAGLTRQTKRHTVIVSALGIRHLVVAVNKMDTVDWSHDAFARIEADFRAFAADLDTDEIVFIPVAARTGDNMVARSTHMGWYRGPTLLEHLEQVEITPAGDGDGDEPFRMPVQWVNRPHADFRGYSGLIASGEVYAGMPVRIWPAGRIVHVKRIATPAGDSDLALAGESVTLTFDEAVDASRGDMLAEASAAPLVSDRLFACVVWMAEAPLKSGRSYLLKAGTATVKATVADKITVVDLDTREERPADRIADNEIGTCVLQLDRRIAVDRYRENRITGSFILLDPESYDTIALGTVQDAFAANGPPRGRDASKQASGTVRESAPQEAARRATAPVTPARGERAPGDSRLRSAANALSCRALATLATFALAFALTGSIGFAGSIALLDVVARTVVYYLHERMWSKIAWGTR